MAEKDLTVRQRIGLLITVLLMIVSIIIAIFRYRVNDAEDTPIQQNIYPITADSPYTGTSASATPDTIVKTHSPKKSKSHGKSSAKVAPSTIPTRDITSEDL
ncbi:MAG: hypothetical protein NC217_06550 [Muribaculaceae bacterium]|nr:hypothetical protein [Muribaculaceae bacterium]